MNPVAAPRDVQAVVVNYNAGPKLLDCVRALLDQPGLGRVWVSDNASRDGSIEALEGLAAAEPRLRILHNGRNLGFGAANNLALRSDAAADWLLVNPDCLLEPGALEALLRCRREHPRAGLMGGLVRNPDGSEQRGCRRDLPRLGASLARSMGLSRFFGRRAWTDFDHTGGPLPAAPVQVGAVSGALMYLRAEALAATGIFDEGYFLHCEDLDLCRRMADEGWEVMFVPDAAAVHFQGTSSRRTPLRVHWHKHRSMWRYYAKFDARGHSVFLNALVWAGIWTRFLLTVPGAVLGASASAWQP
ncbi:MAG TPA: glycosyltransferase family 2 protein [Gammaproteobacteria bacterium]|nr:glycosyltransferase family 2 protein [Gammaproteobacteria bacterium]